MRAAQDWEFHFVGFIKELIIFFEKYMTKIFWLRNQPGIIFRVVSGNKPYYFSESSVFFNSKTYDQTLYYDVNNLYVAETS